MTVECVGRDAGGRGRVGVESKATAIPRRFVVVRGGGGDEVRSRAPRKLGWDGTSFDGTCPVGGGVAAWEGSRRGGGRGVGGVA